MFIDIYLLKIEFINQIFIALDLSIVDLCIVKQGETRNETFLHSRELAIMADSLKYKRFWIAENHNALYFGANTPEALIPYIASSTSNINVGSGPLLLNHYDSQSISRVYNTLNDTYPTRIEMGIGRGQSEYNLMANIKSDFDYDKEIKIVMDALDHHFINQNKNCKDPKRINVPKIRILGSSIDSAKLAATLGISFVFGGFINPDKAYQSIQTYKESFVQNQYNWGISNPEAILAVHAICADNWEDSYLQSAPIHLMYESIKKGIIYDVLPSPAESLKLIKEQVQFEFYKNKSQVIPKIIAGPKDVVCDQLIDIAEYFKVQELVVQDIMTDQSARLRSFHLMSEVIH
jgi:luciferase family oxidoreductase group 1